MSKKTKRLERENQTLTRKHEQTNRNILEMAEERTRDKEEIDRLRKQENKMRNIIKSMQEQGRGLAGGSGGLRGEDLDDEGTESEYDEEYEDEDDYIEGDEEELAAAEAELQAQSRAQMKQPEKPVFGPVPPPDLNSNSSARSAVNGVSVKH